MNWCRGCAIIEEQPPGVGVLCGRSVSAVVGCAVRSFCNLLITVTIIPYNYNMSILFYRFL
nr:MAG TPA: hypothetical protein [Caudoviricetes sp.]